MDLKDSPNSIPTIKQNVATVYITYLNIYKRKIEYNLTNRNLMKMCNGSKHSSYVTYEKIKLLYYLHLTLQEHIKTIYWVILTVVLNKFQATASPILRDINVKFYDLNVDLQLFWEIILLQSNL